MGKQMVQEARQLALDGLARTLQPESKPDIDQAFPEQLVDALSRREVFNKHLFRPNTYLHKWWARQLDGRRCHRHTMATKSVGGPASYCSRKVKGSA